MIIWINGAFGSGKTSVATRLNEIIEKSHIYDPEEVGFYLRSNLPKEMVEPDFQDIELWRLVNYQVILEAAKNYQGTLIVPMTLVNPQYFDEISNLIIQQSSLSSKRMPDQLATNNEHK